MNYRVELICFIFRSWSESISWPHHHPFPMKTLHSKGYIVYWSQWSASEQIFHKGRVRLPTESRPQERALGLKNLGVQRLLNLVGFITGWEGFHMWKSIPSSRASQTRAAAHLAEAQLYPSGRDGMNLWIQTVTKTGQIRWWINFLNFLLVNPLWEVDNRRERRGGQGGIEMNSTCQRARKGGS